MTEASDRRARTIVFSVLAAILLLGVGGYAVYQSGLQTIDAAPDFTLTSTGYENGTQGNGTVFSLSDYRGKTVLLDFMAVLCDACRKVEALVLEPLWEEKRNDTSFVLLSVDTWADPDTGQTFTFGGETNERLAQFQKDHGHDWRHALDTDDVWQKYSAVAIPKIAVIGPEGQIVKEWTGIPALEDVRAVVARSQAGEASAGEVFRLDLPPALLLVGLALVAGGASFFAPCSVGLIPAYMGFLLRGAEQQDAAHRTMTTLRAGLLTAAGIVSVYAVLAIGLWILGLLGYNQAIQNSLPVLAPVIAVILIVFGVLMLFKVSWDWLAKRMGLGTLDGRRGFYTFGAGYGLAAFGCTGPIFLPVLLAGFLEGAVTGFFVFLAYALAIAAFVFVAAVLVATGHQTGLRKMLAKTDIITKVSAVLIIAAGAYLLWYALPGRAL